MKERLVRVAECKVLPCTCTHQWQDKQYGRQMRVFNAAKTSNKAPAGTAYRCTVCARKASA